MSKRDKIFYQAIKGAQEEIQQINESLQKTKEKVAEKKEKKRKKCKIVTIVSVIMVIFISGVFIGGTLVKIFGKERIIKVVKQVPKVLTGEKAKKEEE